MPLSHKTFSDASPLTHFPVLVQAPAPSLVVPPTEALGDEVAAIQAMFQAEESQWVETQEHMAQ